jgi:hypothetical protein
MYQMAQSTHKPKTSFPRPNIQDARKSWEESMLRQVDILRQQLNSQPVDLVAERCGGHLRNNAVRMKYWGQDIEISWPEMGARRLDGTPCNLYDQAVLLYYLHTADGTPFADRWVSFRELPGGTFYHQAFQGYSGDLLARKFGLAPEGLDQSARLMAGDPLTGLNAYAYAFTPLPRLRLAAVLWPGDEEFAARASILFDAHACHYLPIDGCALLGARLVQRLEAFQLG